jgi:hypothetical protein
MLPDAPAGSVTLFSEALVHGTAEWRSPHPRRVLLLKYAVPHVIQSVPAPPKTVTLALGVKVILTPPCIFH